MAWTRHGMLIVPHGYLTTLGNDDKLILIRGTRQHEVVSIQNAIFDVLQDDPRIRGFDVGKIPATPDS